MPSDNTVRRVAVRIELYADRSQLFDLLLERVERLLRKYGVHSSVDLEPSRPSFAKFPSFLYTDPTVLESVYGNNMMTCKIIVAFDVKHLRGLRARPVASELLSWKSMPHW